MVAGRFRTRVDSLGFYLETTCFYFCDDRAARNRFESAQKGTRPDETNTLLLLLQLTDSSGTVAAAMASSRGAFGYGGGGSGSSSTNPMLCPDIPSHTSAGEPIPPSEQLMQLDQAITLTLQEIDANFARSHQSITNRILPAVRRYGVASMTTWEGAKVSIHISWTSHNLTF